MADKIEILNIGIDKVNMRQAQRLIKERLDHNYDTSFMVVTPNPEIVVRAQDDKELASILNSADLAVADGGGLVLASRLLKNKLPERVAGFDLMQKIFNLTSGGGYDIYLLGGKPGVLRKVKNNLKKKYSKIKICGTHHGYIDKSEQSQVIAEINEKKPDLLLVGMGVPLQEKFLDRYLEKLEVKVAMTVGGSFDVLAGEVKRAPQWMQKIYLEWFYRLINDPGRFKRMLSLPRFVFLVFKEAVFKN